MDPIEKLMAEHQNILKGIALLEEGARRLQEGQDVPPDYFRKLIDFIRNYADKYHHAKEEDILFVRMGQAGFSPEAGPVAVMLSEHDQGRGFVSSLEEANEKYASGDKSAVEKIVQNANGYAELLKQHIAKEDSVLYAMARNVLGDAGIDAMRGEFEKVESEKEGLEQRYMKILGDLESALTPKQPS